jgi:hypothetical protein
MSLPNPDKPQFTTHIESGKSDELMLELAQNSELLYKRIMQQRESILEAFIAETGLRPSECMQVVKNTLTRTEWYVRPKNQGE